MDTGPLIAFFDRTEQNHRWIIERIEELDAPLLVCEPVLEEAMHLLGRYSRGIRSAVAQRPEGDWRGRLAGWVKAGVEGYIDTHALHDVVFHKPHHRPDERPPGISAPDTVQDLAALLAAGTSAQA